MKGTVQVSDTHLQASCMARVRSAQQVRRAVAIGVLFIPDTNEEPAFRLAPHLTVTLQQSSVPPGTQVCIHMIGYCHIKTVAGYNLVFLFCIIIIQIFLEYLQHIIQTICIKAL